MSAVALQGPPDAFVERLNGTTEALLDTLDRILPDEDGPERALFAAMRYATLHGGKRIRPHLSLTVARMFDVAERQALRAAAAVEILHCYSLIHDDLPCMDDDELRRGRPTCHIAFGEATAVLAGDALLTLAFDVLADPATHADAEVRIDLVRGLAVAAGVRGMVAGQMIDLALEHRSVDIAAISRLQALKTASLIAFSAETGAILGRADPASREAIVNYGRLVGSAFQIVDDLLDADGDALAMGKTTGKDAAAGKATLVTALGADKALARAQRLSIDAVACLAPFGHAAEPLRETARYVLTRRT